MKKKKSKKLFFISISIIFIILLAIFLFPNSSQDKIKIQTSKGDIIIELNSKAAPKTVENFKTYVEEGFYDGTVFHRIIPDFMIQGGGFIDNGQQKQTHDPIILESNNGLSNKKYTIAMARTNSPNSATSQFFINTKDNSFLDYTPINPGYAVFGKVINGFEIVDEIEKSQTTTKHGYMADWPIEEIIIEKITFI
jgi:peptidyl-prolyl cis-trans isomerase B (cyclophilin B)